MHCRFNAATPEKLWNAFENVLYDAQFDFGGNVTVTEFMRSWTEQPGYPLVEIVRDNVTFVVTQVDVDDIDNALTKKNNDSEKNK